MVIAQRIGPARLAAAALFLLSAAVLIAVGSPVAMWFTSVPGGFGKTVADVAVTAVVIAMALTGAGVGLGYVTYRRLATAVVDAGLSADDSRRLALTDALTGLGNRRAFFEWLPAAMKTTWTDGVCVVMLIDLDGFKDVNDSFGHGDGDRLLIEVAKRLARFEAPGVRIARIGGDEFAVLITNPAEASRVQDLGLAVCGAMRQPFDLGSRTLSITASIGHARARHETVDGSSLMRDADLAAYAAKQAGRDCVVEYSAEFDADHRHGRHLDRQLRAALLTKEIEVHFQPQVDAYTGAFRGAEALVRWRHPYRGLILPGEFIPIAEKSDLICMIGAHVLRTAARAASEVPGMRVSVNVSARQLRSGVIVDLVDEVLAQTGLDPALLQLEITESSLVEDPDEAATTFEALRQRRVRLALDDFGTGYSSLAYLQRFRFDVLKIDRHFVRLSVDDMDVATIVQSIVGLARALRMQVVAEGVETAEQQRFLAAIGCQELQGYLFGRPMPFGELRRERLDQAARGADHGPRAAA